MKLLKVVVSLITASMMCCTFTGAAYSETTNPEIDISSKISTRLLEEYGISANSLENANSRKKAVKNADIEKIPVIVWCTEDINHETVEKQTLPLLTENIKSAKQNSMFSSRADVSLDDVLNSDEELSAEAIQDFIEAERASSRDLYEELNGQFVEKYMADADIAYISQYSPVILAKLTLDEVVKLAESDSTLEFDYCGNDNEEIEQLDISTKATNTHLVHTNYAYTGTGVKIGQIEGYVPDTTNTQLSSISNSQIHFDTNNPAYVGSHATLVACVLVGQSTDNYSTGIAPDADLYCSAAEYYIPNDVSNAIPATEWLLSEGVNVINASISFGSNDKNTYMSYAKWLDHIAIDHYVTFVQSAGNKGAEGVSSGAMAYNIITVGNIDDKGTETVSDDIINSSSSYNTNSDLAYKPDLCAPGTNIETSVSVATGTSLSAPHVTGAVALLFQAKPQLKLKPAIVKSILTSAVNPESRKRYCPSYWSVSSTTDSYAKYGAGLLDVYRAIRVARSGNYFFSSLTPTQNEEEFTINITEPKALVRVSLAYLKNNYAYWSDRHEILGGVYYTDLQDLDLHIYAPNGTLVGKSTTPNNNVEIVEFKASQAGTYKIKVSKYGSELTETVDYGLSWMEVSYGEYN